MKFLRSITSGLRKSNNGYSRSFIRNHPGLVLYLLITLLITSLYLNNVALFSNFEAKFHDVLFKVRETSAPSGQVVLLAIDNRSLDLIGNWPWNHQRMAQLVEALTYYKPKVVVMQTPIEENVDDYVSGTSQLLAENILQAENIILPFFPLVSSRTPLTHTTPEWLKNSALSSILPFEGEHVPLASRIELPADLFGPSCRLVAASQTQFDSGNKVRRQPLMFKFERHFLPSIELAAASCAMDVPLDRIQFSQNEEVITIGSRSIPVNRKGEYFINFLGPPSTFASHSVADFWNGEIEVEEIRDKVVIVAMTALGLADELSTPLGDEFTIAEKSANVIENILTGEFIKPLKASSNTELIAILAIGLFCAVILPRVSLIYRFIVLFVFALVIVNINFLLFTRFDTLANTFYPTLEVLLFAIAAPALTVRPKQQARAIGKTTSEADAVPEPGASKADRTMKQAIDRKDAKGEILKTSQDDTIKFDSIANSINKSETPIPASSGKHSGKDQGIEIGTSGVPTCFGRYEVIDKLGSGAMGTVYKGKDPAIGRMVALKTIRLDKIADASEIEELRERLIREANAAGMLSHPNIVTIYDVGQESDLQYIAMEYLEGYTLEQVISRKLELNFRIAAKIVYQVCSALTYAHSHNIIHRDVKPANIMVLDNFHIKVMDFGIAHFESSNLTQTGIAMGTPNYISPEQLKGEPVTVSSDIFSLGVVLYEILTGTKPFVGENISNLILKITTEHPPPPSSFDDKIPPMLDHIVKKSLEKNPYDRYQSANEMGKALEDFASDLSRNRTSI